MTAASQKPSDGAIETAGPKKRIPTKGRQSQRRDTTVGEKELNGWMKSKGLQYHSYGEKTTETKGGMKWLPEKKEQSNFHRRPQKIVCKSHAIPNKEPQKTIQSTVAIPN